MLTRTRRFALSLLFIALISCGGAFRDAIDRGDQAASEGLWDRAAEAYERAVRLEPKDEEARQKLQEARREQAKQRVAKGKALMAEGRAADAMQPFFDAIRYDPRNLEGQSGYESAKAQVIAEAEAALAAGELKEAHRLTRHVLLFEPKHERAKQLEVEITTKIAILAVARAEAHEKKGELALALIDYGEALRYKPSHAGAQTGSEATRTRLRKEVTYFVALKNFDGEKKVDDFGADVNAEVLSRGLDPSLPLRVLGELPPEAKTSTLQGMRLGGVFRGYRYDRSSRRATRTCSYVCGKDRVANPEYPTAEAEMRAAQSALGAAEGRVSAAKAAVGPAEKAREAAKKKLSDRRGDVQRADQDLSRCRSASGVQPGSCRAEEDRLGRAKDDERRAQDDLRNSESAEQDAKREQSDAESDLSRKRTDADGRKRDFESTPATIEVDRFCDHKYSVETVTVAGEVECALRGEGIYDTNVVMAQGVVGRFTTFDETFPAQKGVCSEVANGDPLKIPAEPEVRKAVLASAIAATQKQLLTQFDGYRQGYWTRGKEAISDNKNDAAIDLLVRFSLTRGQKESSKDFVDARSELVRISGTDELSVTRALDGVAP